MTAALSTVAMLRSYSRNTGSTSLEAVAARPGASSAQDRQRAALMRRVGEGVQEADRDGARRRRPAARARRRAPRPRRAAISSLPSAPMRPATSKTRDGRHGALRLDPGAEVVAPRDVVRGRSPARGGSPAVVISAVGAALPSRIRLVATVVPCSTRPISVGAAPAPGRAPARTPVTKASDGSRGVDGVLAVQAWPVAASSSVMSVKVPPMSTATSRRGTRQSMDIGILAAMEQPCGGGPVGAQALRRRRVHARRRASTTP